MSAINTSLAGLLGAQKRFEEGAKRVVAAGAETSNALAESQVAAQTGTSAAAQADAQAGSQAGGQAAAGPGGVRFSSDLAGAVIDLLSAEHSFKANAAAAGRIADAERDVLDALTSDRSSHR